jgi:hypothetical protein
LDRFRRRRELDLTPYEGRWVAVKNGRVIAHGHSPRDLMHNHIFPMGKAGRGCTIWYHARPNEAERWGVYYLSQPGWVSPNCLFDSREEAERFAERGVDGERGYVVNRTGQYDPWRNVEPTERGTS